MSLKLKTKLGQLPPNELVELIHSTEQEKIDKQWFEEGDRRAEAIANGKIKLVSSTKANKRIKTTLKRLQNHI